MKVSEVGAGQLSANQVFRQTSQFWSGSPFCQLNVRAVIDRPQGDSMIAHVIQCALSTIFMRVLIDVLLPAVRFYGKSQDLCLCRDPGCA